MSAAGIARALIASMRVLSLFGAGRGACFAFEAVSFGAGDLAAKVEVALASS